MEEFQKSSLPFLFTCFLIIHAISAASDAICSSNIIRDGESIVSSGGRFELGFFSPGNSGNRYLAIWYKNITVRTYVWVANREVPLTSKSGVLKVMERGSLVLLNESSSVIWSSNTSRTVQNPAAQLLDSGNLVVKDANEDYIWQSFDYPSDTYLPGMSIGWNFVTGFETYLSSWRSHDDPAPGEFTTHLDPSGYPQALTRKGKAVYYRYGPWNGVLFGGAPLTSISSTSNDPIYRSTFQMNKNELTIREDTVDPSVVSRTVISPNGVRARSLWNYRTQEWDIFNNMPADNCDRYNLCGDNGICNAGNSPSCGCLDKFVPKDPESWSRQDWSKGCMRRTPLNCPGDAFLKYSGIKLPDSQNSTFNDQKIPLTECQEECSRDCLCMAYTQLYIKEPGGGCLFYYRELIDIRTVLEGGQDLYIRMASTESENVAASNGKRRVILIASLTSVAGAVLACLSLIVFCTLKRKKDPTMKKEWPFSGSHVKEADLPFFSLSTILKATDHFSINNKLGEGGFGPVYRGMLEDGREIAVKRLSRTSSQGPDELKNEVILIAKLQHRNLVRLLGCCIQRKENMLIYEYMPNNSLNVILFDQTKRVLLDWRKRFHIIKGIAKGLLYLHQDSRLRIIHRDLKASNILLDADMNPKISDFGIARSFRGNETVVKTRRVVGTYGYMSPEYAIDGLFSVKSDVFSYGVLLLEIVSGKRNRGFYLKDQNLNLLGHAWTLYKEDNSFELVDASLGDSFDLSEVVRSINVGLLCVQKHPEDRPTMSSVVFMLENELALPQAKPPSFFTEADAFSFSSKNETCSDNQVTITWPEGR